MSLEIKNKLFNGDYYGWSKSSLTLLCAIVCIAPPAANAAEKPIQLNDKLIISIIIANYLLSQQQLEKSTAEQYSDPFYLLLSSECKLKHIQWVNGGFKILDEMAEHYINTQKLKAHLMTQHNFTF